MLQKEHSYAGQPGERTPDAASREIYYARFITAYARHDA
jgi:hypothetical protein